MKLAIAICSALLCAGLLVVQAQDRPQAYTGATILPVSGPAITDGVLVVHRGKIVAVGSRSSVRIPADAQRHDANGKTIMPGLVDTHSHIGSGSGGDGSAPIQPDARILDSINVRSSGLQRAQAGGITTVNVMPGSGHLLSGQTLYLKVKDGRVVDDLLIRDAQGNIAGGLKMANGTNSLRPGSTGPFPGTRAKSAALVREQFLKAIDYRGKIERAKGDAAKLPARDLGLETLVEVLNGKRTVHFHTHRHDDILTALRLAKEFNFRVVLHHVSEGWKVAEEIAAAKAPSSIIVIDSPGGKLEAVDYSSTNGAVLDRAGVLVGFHTDDSVTDSRFLLRSAAMAVRYGMPRERALFALTLAGARMLDLENPCRLTGNRKRRRLLILSGDPFSVYTHVLETYVEGVKVFDRSRPEDRLIATGGYGASRDESLNDHCFEGAEGGEQR